MLLLLFRHRPALTAITLLALAQVCLAADPAGTAALRPPDPLNQAAFEHYYNLDYDAAIQDFERIAARHPNDPLALNHLLSAIQVRELYRMGAMNSGEYSNDNFIGQAHRPADPAQKERIKQLVQQAEKLENAELALRFAAYLIGRGDLQCRRSAPRSRTGARVGSAVHRRQAGRGSA